MQRAVDHTKNQLIAIITLFRYFLIELLHTKTFMIRKTLYRQLFHFLLLLLLFGFSTIYAQQNVIDSLKNVISQVSGEERVDELNALSFYYGSDFENRYTYGLEALKEAEEVGYDRGKAEALRNIGYSFYIQQKYDKAMEYYQQSYAIFSEHTDSLKFALLNINMGDATEKLGIPDSAIAYQETAIDYCEAIPDSHYLALAHTNIGLIHWRATEYELALEQFLEAASIRKSSGEIRLYGSSLNNIGVLYWQWGIYEKAIEYYLQALEIMEQKNSNYQIVIILNNVGLVNMKLNKPEVAKSYFRRALDLALTTDYTNSTAYSYHNLGVYHKVKASYDSALYYFEHALKKYIEIDLKDGIAMASNSIGDVYAAKKEYQQALSYYNDALKVSKEWHQTFREAESFKRIGSVHNELGNYHSALQYIKESLALSKEDNIIDLMKENYFLLSQIYESLGNTSNAYNAYKQYTVLKDSIFNERSENIIAELQTRYDITKKEKEIELLRREKTIRDLELDQQKTITRVTIIVIVMIIILLIAIYFAYREKKSHNILLQEKNRVIENQKNEVETQKKEVEDLNEELQTQNELLAESEAKLQDLNSTKDKFISIIAHDIKNPFTTIIGFSEVLHEDFDELTSEEMKDYIFSIHDASKTTFDFLNNLLIWASTQRGQMQIEPEPITLHEMINASITLLHSNASRKNITILNNVDHSYKIFADANSMNTVFRNLISNALKFTPKGGNVTISAMRSNKHIDISFTDTGIGIDADKINELFSIDKNTSTPGTEEEQGTGLGLIICHEFVEKNHGKISATSIVGSGSTFTVTVPNYGE